MDNHHTDHGLPDPRRAAHQCNGLVELLDDGVVVLRKDGYIKYINAAAMRIVGLGPAHKAADCDVRSEAGRPW